MRSLGQFILLRIPENYSIRVGGDDGVLREVRIGVNRGVPHVVRIEMDGGVDHIVRDEIDEVHVRFSLVHFKICVNYVLTLIN